MAKPIVDGLEKDLEGSVTVIRIDIASPLGQQLGERFGVNALPTILVLDRAGNTVYQKGGLPARAGILNVVRDLQIR